MNPRIKLAKEKKQLMIEGIKKYYLNDRDEEIGDLAAGLLLDFIMESIAPVFYNQGIEDCIGFMKDKLDDLYGLEI